MQEEQRLADVTLLVDLAEDLDQRHRRRLAVLRVCELFLLTRKEYRERERATTKKERKQEREERTLSLVMCVPISMGSDMRSRELRTWTSSWGNEAMLATLSH